MTATILRLCATLAAAAALVLTGATRAHAAVQVKVITHNIDGGHQSVVANPAAVNAAVSEARSWGADLVLLQEVCQQQLQHFKAELPGWDEFASQMWTSFAGCDGKPLLDVVASRYQLTGMPTPDGPAYSITHGFDTSGRRYHLTCAHVEKPGTAGRLVACTTHLWTGGSADQIATRKAQTREIHNLLQPLVFEHDRVVLGGDFNAQPWRDEMSSIYHLDNGGGYDTTGEFFEGDQTDRTYWSMNPFGCGPNACRAGQPTHGAAKIDYVFFSDEGASDLHGLARGQGLSDHNLYRGAGSFSF